IAAVSHTARSARHACAVCAQRTPLQVVRAKRQNRAGTQLRHCAAWDPSEIERHLSSDLNCRQMADFDAPSRFGRRIARKSDADAGRGFLYQELEIGCVTFDRADALDATA